jgi:AcrR family transcriptional regulator
MKLRAGGKQETEKRAYRKQARAEAEQATIDSILGSAFSAFAHEPFDRVTLQSIAEHSGVTVQTVIRHFGSKEKLFEALVEREAPRILARREPGEDAGLSAALGALLDHYEEDADMVLNFISQEHLFEPVRRVVELGRGVHREWVETHCADILAGTEGVERERLIHAAIAATDVSTWKLLRRDLGLEQSEVAAVMLKLLEGLKPGEAHTAGRP